MRQSNMGSPFIHEIKKQASCFLKEKIKSARLILTDVTPAELMTEEATNANPWPPNTRNLGVISRAAFEVDDYWRIVEILHQRLSNFDRKNWKVSYKALVLLGHLLTHGPLSISKEFQPEKDVIADIGKFQYIDERGFNWGLSVKKLSERTLELLENEAFLKQERERARKITRGIQGFGSFNCNISSSLLGKPNHDSSRKYGRCNSNYNIHHKGDDENSNPVDHPFCDDENHKTAALLSMG